MPATSGDETLVPPYTAHPLAPVVWYTATPVFGSPTAATSASVRFEQPVSFCQLGLAMYPLQPLPPLDHAVSVHPRALLLLLRLVPPTARTYCEVAGNSAPYAWSPELAVTRTPGWL